MQNLVKHRFWMAIARHRQCIVQSFNHVVSHRLPLWALGSLWCELVSRWLAVPFNHAVCHRLALWATGSLCCELVSWLYCITLYYTILYCIIPYYIVSIWLAQNRLWLICYWILIRNERQMASAGSEQVLVDLLLNSNKKWRANGVGWLKADFGWFAIEFW